MTELKPMGGWSGVAKYCKKYCNKNLATDTKDSKDSKDYSRMLHDYHLEQREKTFEADRVQLLEKYASDLQVVEALQKTTPKDLVTRYCYLESSVPKKWYVKNVTSLKDSKFEYSYQLVWLYSLMTPETMYEQYVKHGPEMFTDENGVTPSKTFVEKNPKMFFFDEPLDMMDNMDMMDMVEDDDWYNDEPFDLNTLDNFEEGFSDDDVWEEDEGIDYGDKDVDEDKDEDKDDDDDDGDDDDYYDDY
jgi:hypothetical protein